MDGEYDFKDLFEAYLQESERDVSWLARQLGKAPSTVSRWYHCETRPQNPAVLVQIAELLEVPDGERATFFTTAATYYGWSLSVFALALIPTQAAQTIAEPPLPLPTEVPSHHTPQPEPSPETETAVEAKGWWWNQTERFFRWSAADAHAQSSWEGMVLYGLSQAKDRLMSDVALRAVVVVILWYITFGMTSPALRWTIETNAERLYAFVLLAATFIIVPLCVAATTPAEKESDIVARGWSARLQLALLKCTGAWVGFMVGGIVMFAPALLWYYGTGGATPGWLRGSVVALPLGLSYLAVRRIPVDRLKMFKNDFRLHRADRWFLGAGIIAGPCFAFYLYTFYETLSHPLYGPTMILTFMLLAALLVSKQHRETSH